MKKAIVRKPASSLRDGLTMSELGRPDFAKALAQHSDYCSALKRCDIEVITLESAEDFPDSVFVEDTAVITRQCAILTRPGAESRLGEVKLIEPSLTSLLSSVVRIEEPGTVDGGDICEAGNHYFIGISERTNEAGAQQLSRLLAALGYSCSFVDVRGIRGLLHLKSGVASLGRNRLVVIAALAGRKEFSGYELVRVEDGEAYAANCVRISDHVLIAKGYPRLSGTLARLGYKTIALDMSEFQKLDGGLSCLSLRF